MDSAVPGGAITAPPIEADIDVLTVEVEDEGFEVLYDVPFVTVNRVPGNLIEAEVWLSGVAEIDFDRLSAALTEGRKHGFVSYSRIFGDDGQVLIQFSNNPDEGLIWALEDELGLPAW